jgi:hypothetical protein
MLKKRYYVLAPSYERFLAWLQSSGHKLVDCVYMGDAVDMRGIDFSDPLRVFVILEGAMEGREDEYREEAARLIARYCLARHVHSITETRT